MGKRMAELKGKDKITLDEAVIELLTERVLEEIEKIEMKEADSDKEDLPKSNLNIDFDPKGMSVDIQVRISYQTLRGILLITLIIFATRTEAIGQIASGLLSWLIM